MQKDWLSSLLAGFLALFDSRVLLLLIPAMAYLFWLDAPMANTIVYSLVVVTVVAAWSHFTRKVFFPYLDLKDFAAVAIRDPIAAAIVFLSVSIVLCMLLFVTASWVAR
jgi:hypothetical protein